MFVATSARRFVFAATVIIASVLGTAGAVTASAAASTGAVAGQAHPAAVTHVLADGPDDTPWG